MRSRKYPTSIADSYEFSPPFFTILSCLKYCCRNSWLVCFFGGLTLSGSNEVIGLRTGECLNGEALMPLLRALPALLPLDRSGE